MTPYPRRFDHPRYRPYDAIAGKLISLSPTGRVYTCAECGRRFLTRDDRAGHVTRVHGRAA